MAQTRYVCKSAGEVKDLLWNFMGSDSSQRISKLCDDQFTSILIHLTQGDHLTGSNDQRIQSPVVVTGWQVRQVTAWLWPVNLKFELVMVIRFYTFILVVMGSWFLGLQFRNSRIYEARLKHRIIFLTQHFDVEKARQIRERELLKRERESFFFSLEWERKW